MSAPAASPALCWADDATFWPWLRWPEFSRWPDPAGTVVIVPIAGMADWGLGHPFDAEETLLLQVLRSASQARPESLRMLVIPPLRFVLGPASSCAFPVDPPVAHALIAEVVASIAASGFRRVVLYNSSPWNEELIAAAARDLRIAHGLQLFRISLSGLGLDLHPVRSRSRREAQSLLTHLLDRAPEPSPADAPASSSGWGEEPVQPLPEPSLALEAARKEGPILLAAAAARLLSLLGEISQRAPLAHNGIIPTARP